MKHGKVLRVEDIRYRDILNGVSFEWHQGEIIALLGVNGSGKSTLARLLAGLIEPESGQIQLNEQGTLCTWETVTRWQELGLVGQHPRRQMIGATVAEELSFGLINLGRDPRWVREKVRELASVIGLEGKEDQSPATLSGGERQRLVTVAILAMQPTFLILDEALSMLDARAEAKVLDILLEARTKTGQLWITHDLELAKKADRLLLLQKGRIVDICDPHEAFTDAQVEFQDCNKGVVGARLPNLSQNSTLLAQEHRPVLEWRQANFPSRLTINHAVKPGEFIGVVGASGSGKTTLLESAMGLIFPKEGQLCFDGERLSKSNINSLRRKTSLLLQEAGEYLIGRSVYHEIFYGDTTKDLKTKTQDKLSYIKEFGIQASLADLPPECLSGGERQKVALAAALRTHPEILLLDEPLIGLDLMSRASIQAIISRLKDRTILYVTHDLREILSMANRIWLLEKGNLVLDCSVKNWQDHKEQLQAAGVRC